jgi:hypothetical protein
MSQFSGNHRYGKEATATHTKDLQLAGGSISCDMKRADTDNVTYTNSETNLTERIV